jgi:hypothetical protein
MRARSLSCQLDLAVAAGLRGGGALTPPRDDAAARGLRKASSPLLLCTCHLVAPLPGEMGSRVRAACIRRPASFPRMARRRQRPERIEGALATPKDIAS